MLGGVRKINKITYIGGITFSLKPFGAGAHIIRKYRRGYQFVDNQKSQSPPPPRQQIIDDPLAFVSKLAPGLYNIIHYGVHLVIFCHIENHFLILFLYILFLIFLHTTAMHRIDHVSVWPKCIKLAKCYRSVKYTHLLIIVKIPGSRTSEFSTLMFDECLKDIPVLRYMCHIPSSIFTIVIKYCILWKFIKELEPIVWS